jgi:hypothetical protein
VVVIDNSFQRATGLVKGDFTIALYDPSGSDIAGSTSIVVTEFGATGAYEFAVSIPTTPAGNYTLSVTDPYGNTSSCVLMAYVTLQGDTGDTSAQLELWIHDGAGNPISGVVVGDLTKRIYNPSRNEVAAVVSPTLTELAPGHYTFGFDSSSEQGVWFLDILHPTYFPLGQQGYWLYLSATVEVSDPPSLDAAVNDGTGTSATLTYTAQDPADTIYTYYRLCPSGSWVLSAQTRVGSGDVQITGLSNRTQYEFIGVASKSGSPIINQSAPSITRRVYVWDQATLFDGIRQALWEWVDGQVPSGVTVIWLQANAPMPAQPFVTLLMRPLRDIHRDYHTGPDDAGIAQIYADREFVLEIQVYGTLQPDGADLAMTYLEDIKASLQEETTINGLAAADLAPRQALPTQDLSAIGRQEFEARYMFEAIFGWTYEHDDDVGYIGTSDAPTGSYS